MKKWLIAGRDTFTTQLWPIPTEAVVAAVLLGLGLPVLDSGLRGPMGE